MDFTHDQEVEKTFSIGLTCAVIFGLIHFLWVLLVCGRVRSDSINLDLLRALYIACPAGNVI